MTMGTILKRYRLILCCALLFMSGAGSASAQHYIGVMGGWGGGSARFKPAKETGYEWGLYSGGLSYKFYSDTKYVGAIEIDLMFTQKGFNYDLAFESDESYHRRINAIELPLIWQPHFYLFQRHARFFINLGIQVSYNLSSTYSRVSKTTGILESGKYAMQLNRDNRFGYGLCGGAGLAFLFGQQRRYEFSVEARYGFGYGDILRNGAKYKGNPDRSPLDNINVFAAFYYRLGKEGIRSAPSAAAQQRMEQEAARHTLRRLNKMLDKGKIPADTLLLLTLPRDSAGNIPIDSTTIEAVRLYQTAPSVPDTLQGKPQSDTLQTPQPTGSNKRKSQPGSTAPTNGTAPATGNGQANNAIPTNTATAGNGTMQQNGEAAGTETSAKSSSPATTGANSAEEIQPSSSPHSLSPGEKAPQPAEPPRSGSDNGMETAVLSAS